MKQNYTKIEVAEYLGPNAYGSRPEYSFRVNKKHIKKDTTFFCSLTIYELGMSKNVEIQGKGSFSVDFISDINGLGDETADTIYMFIESKK